ncbi:MAG: exodeoxyribonuclease VII small subunit [Leptolyngbyaceae cyanobacterium SM1_1_3]|nr:exodeoxyribonuclease VII small subunit [Leptolyngbyaceae cyanobacterium SM1_1_3]NJM85538.1 exodeoxyribonuclease VII small subunit [Leptolyngbyaceae cyanobacterium RM2_2_21]NJN02220.1 exodeoxyribonuclease VII small subunit [Leptolyngbyaceae cyanobacterium RM1_1_2]NJO09800.1 exodeoxyribonuclease VII small subunit [Leptolyngbyaceae cyanobacterium SL_1_1]
MKKQQPKSGPNAWQYEQAIAHIEATIHQIETAELPLAETIEQFTQAAEHLQQCKAFLNQKQQQVDLLIESLTTDDATESL